MKLNNRGFAISTIMYMILIMAITLIILTLSLLSNRNIILEKIKDDAMENVYKLPEETRLPLQYQEVEYIESTGTQYIFTDIIPDDTTGIELDFSISDTSGDTIFFGSRSTTSGRFWNGQNGGYFYFGWNSTTANADRIQVSIDKRIVARMNYNNDRKLIYEGEIFADIVEQLMDNTQRITIFSGNDNGTINYFSKIKLYKFIITRETNVIAHFVPCYRKLDGNIGLYDIIGNKFYANEGSGLFTRGGFV